MARITPGVLITDIRGKVGGSVFQKNSSGLILRNSTRNVDVVNSKTSARRASMQSVQVGWRTITAAQRTQWNAWSAFNPIVQQNNAGKFLSGHQCYVQINFYRSLFSLTSLSSPVFTKSSLLPAFPTLYQGVDDLSCITSRDIDSTNEIFILFLSPPISKGRTQATNATRLIVFDQSSANDFNIAAAYISLFGAVPNLFDNVAQKWAIMDKTNGVVTAYSSNTTIVTI